MIPISLTIQGLYSYRNRQTIDFTKLTQAGLFGIFGSVGCGKSTILEAISFALFGETERLNSRENRNYNMMNLKSSDLLIDFEFKTGTDLQYRFVVKGKRNSKRFEDVKTFERSAYKFDNGNWEPIETSAAESIIGLNYNNFHRTIIIPQGQFQEFLQLSAKDRTVMLRELFNLDKFELYGRVVTLENKNNAAIQNFKGQLLSIGEINPNEIIEKEKLLEEQQQDLLKYTDELQVKQKKEQEYEQIKMLFQKLEEQKKQLLNLNENKNTIEAQEQELKEYEFFIMTFKSDLDQLNMLENSYLHMSSEQKILEEQKDLLTKQLQEKEKEFETVLNQFNEKEKLLKKSEELLKIIEIHKLNSLNEQLDIRCKKGKTALENKVKSIEETRQKITTLKEYINLINKELPDLLSLSAIRNWFTQNKHLTSSLSEIKTRIEKLDKEIELQNKEILLLPQLHGLKVYLPSNCNLENINTAIEDLKGKTERKKELLEKEIFNLEIINQLGTIANNLETGQPCPLCGSEHHPNIFDAQHNSTKFLIIKTEHAESASLIIAINNFEKKLINLKTLISSLKKQKEQELSLLQDYTSKQQEHLTKFNWTGFSPDNEAQLNEAFEKSIQLTQQIEIQNKELDNLSKFNDQEAAEKEKYIKYLDEFERQIVENKSKIELLSGQLSSIDIAENENKTNESLISAADDLKKQHAEIIHNHLIKEKQLTNFRNDYNMLSGRLEANEKALLSMNNNLKTIENQLNEKLKSSANITREHVESVLAKQINIAVIKNKIEIFRNELQSVTKQIAQIESELQGKYYEEQQHTELKIQLQDLTNLINKQNQEIGKIKTEIDRQKSDLKRFLVLKKELDQFELRGQDITELKNLFKGSAFVNYISTVYLKNLCKVANERFYKLTRQKLSLELANDNSFEVRDFMNEGKLRNIKTLSGGQTFQASLSLALALADTIQKISTGHENFFFLDEGFGTLDKDSLNIVFDTLKSLRRENRIVGVISHVEEMQQEIETYLKVTNTEEKGSIIQTSWEA
jgi:exonuclease SbcC